MAHATGRFDPSSGDALTARSLPLFFAVLRLLLEGGVTVVPKRRSRTTCGGRTWIS
jgi:hypothetical protein